MTSLRDPGNRRPARARALGLALLLVPVSAQGQLRLEGQHRVSILQNGEIGATQLNEQFGASLAAGDFDGDGHDDLAVGAPFRNVSGQASAGAVVVFYGTPTGLNKVGGRASVLLHQDNDLDQQQDAEAGDRFGHALAALDVNGDGRDELVVGVPYEDFSIPIGKGVVEVHDNAGCIHVYSGTASGILPTLVQQIDAGDFGSTIYYQEDANLGWSLAAGERNGDIYEDLVLGMPGTSNAGGAEAGASMLLPGSGSGFSLSTSPYYAPHGLLDAGDRFASAIALGDFNDGGVANEIAYGVPFAESVADPNDDEGAVFLYFPGVGVDDIYGQIAGYRHGTAVAAGDFLGLGYDQILMGQPGSDAAGPVEAGRVWLWDAHAGGLPRIFDQGLNTMLEQAESYDRLGAVLAAGDFDGNGIDDAVFGVPAENRDDASADPFFDAGVVHVQYGDPTGVGVVRRQLWQWSAADFGFSPKDFDRFGGSLAVGDFDGDGTEDLAIGAPTADWFAAGAGIVQILYGTPIIFADGFESGGTGAWSP